jgi:hypothetical protein
MVCAGRLPRLVVGNRHALSVATVIGTDVGLMLASSAIASGETNEEDHSCRSPSL